MRCITNSRRLRFYYIIALFICQWLGVSSHIHAAASQSVVTPHVRASLVSELDRVEPGQSFWVALHFEIIPEWHTYWRNAGDSGNAPRLSWQLPPGVIASEIHWPYPERIPIGPLMNYGYSHEAWMLVRISIADMVMPDQSIQLHANAEWLVCKEECIPEEGQLSLTLPVVANGTSQSAAQTNAFRALEQQLPQTLPWSTELIVADTTLRLIVATGQLDAQRLADLYFFPQQYGVVEHAAHQSYLLTPHGFELTLQRGDLRGQPLDRLQGLLLISENLADGKLTRAFTLDIPASTTSSAPNLLMILTFALLGGMLLNIMPCVFPILSLKALSIVNSAAQSTTTVRRNGYAFTLGVLLSFAVIAMALLLLRAGGEAIGWGFQLQSPGFVLLLAWLMFSLGLMLSGVWTFGVGWIGAGQQLTQRQGLTGSFFTGVLAVVVATPCTAPFMGTALGYALSQPTAIALAIFVILGLGMALPWLLISLWPGLASYLPRPGAWMERVKQLLAFPLYATVAWLLWVLAQQVDPQQLLLALLSLVLLALTLWLWQVTRLTSRGWRRFGTITGVLLLLSLFILDWQISPANKTAISTGSQDWQAYDPVKLAEYRRAGKPVFVNFTAAWCITCLVNEKVALATPAVQQQLRARNVVYMKGDWTNKDPVITKVLEQYQRSGVPLYLLYPAQEQAAAIVLPNVLTEGLVLDALQQLDQPH